VTPRTFKSSLCLILTLLNAVLAFGGTADARVLCIGSDGHVAVEMSGTHADCATSAPYDGQAADAPAIEACPCVDVPLASGASVSVSRPTSASRPLLHVTPAPLAAFLKLDAPALGLAPAFAPESADHGATSLGALRTVILVI
jgi:hypothetical protein